MNSAISGLEHVGHESAYNILCQCDRWYVSGTVKPLGVRTKAYRHGHRQGLMEKSKFAQHAHEEGRHVSWREARVVQTVSARQHM
jgi:hypothetical protein